MRYRTHLAFGILLGVLSVKHGFFSISFGHGFLLLVLLGSLLPDLDKKKSKISHKIPILPRVLEFFAGHRGVYHSIFGCLATALVLSPLFAFSWGKALVLAICLGFLSHLLIDSINPKGIRWFRPLSSMKVKGPVKVGGFWEDVLFVFFLMWLFVIVLEAGLGISAYI